MQNDLFDKRPVKQRLLEFIRSRSFVRTSEVIRWGIDHFSNGAERAARLLAEEGYIRRMTDEEKKWTVGIKTKEEIWILNEN